MLGIQSRQGPIVSGKQKESSAQAPRMYPRTLWEPEYRILSELLVDLGTSFVSYPQLCAMLVCSRVLTKVYLPNAAQKTRLLISRSSSENFLLVVRPALSTWMPKSTIIRNARPAYSQAALRSSPNANRELHIISRAWIVVMSLLSRAPPRSPRTRSRNFHPAVRTSSASLRSSRRGLNLDALKKIAFSKSLEKFGPLQAISRMKAGRYVMRKEWCCRFQCRDNKC